MALTKANNRMIDGAVINVLDYGATGDGTTDDTSAIQAAIDAAQGSPEKSVYFPAGTYVTSSSINVTDRIRIYGEGVMATTIQSSASDYAIYANLGDPLVGSSSYWGFSVESMSITGSGFNGGTQYGLWIRGAAYGNCVRDVKIGGCSVYCLYLDNCWTFLVDNVTIWNQSPTDAATAASTAGGIYAETPHAVIIQNTNINLLGGQGYGIYLNAGDACSIVNNSIENVGLPVRIEGCDNASIRNNYFEQRAWSGGHDYALAGDTRNQITVGETTACKNIEITANHFVNGNNRRLFALYNLQNGQILNNRSYTLLTNPCHFYIPTPANVSDVEVASNDRIFIAQPYTGANLVDYYDSLRVTDREIIDIPLEEFAIDTGSPALVTVSGVKAWAFDAAAAEEIRAVVPYPSHWGAGDNVYVSLELLVGVASAGGNAVIEARPNVVAADGSTALSFSRYASVQGMPGTTGTALIRRDNYYKPSTATYRWTNPVTTTESAVCIPVRRNGPNVNDTNTGDMYLYGVRLVREPYNYEYT